MPKTQKPSLKLIRFKQDITDVYYIRENGTFGELKDARNTRLLNKCFVCNHHFEDNEKIYTAFCTKTKNKILCSNCARDLIKKLELISNKQVTDEPTPSILVNDATASILV